MGLAKELAALKSKSNPDGLCSVGLWRSHLDSEDRSEFDAVMDDFGISASDIIKVLGNNVPFKRTTLVVHRRGECSCQN